MKSRRPNQFLLRALSLVPDRLYLSLKYRRKLGFWPDLRRPTRFTEKLQWLKLNERIPAMTVCADKLALKGFVVDRIGPSHVIPALCEGRRAEELELSKIPDRPFVLKTNHDSGGTMLAPNPGSFDLEHARAWLRGRLALNFYSAHREWEYKNITPKWFIEPLIADPSGNKRLNDFKVHCFNGEPKFIQTIFDREEGVKENWFDTDWKEQEFWYFSQNRKAVPKPEKLDEALSIARRLSRDFRYVRVDLYICGDSIYVGEMTFRPYGGLMRWKPPSADVEIGRLLVL